MSSRSQTQSERLAFPVDGRRRGPDRDLEEGPRRGTTAHRPRELDPEGLRQPSSPSPESCLATGPNPGAGPMSCITDAAPGPARRGSSIFDPLPEMERQL
jgi:hypothetical protein